MELPTVQTAAKIQYKKGQPWHFENAGPANAAMAATPWNLGCL
jgi:hypothetical protein